MPDFDELEISGQIMSLLPRPTQGEDITKLRMLLFPRDHLPSITEFSEVARVEFDRLVATPDLQDGAFAGSLLGKDDGKTQPVRRMPDGRLAPFLAAHKSVPYRPLDVDVFHVAATLGFPKRNENVPSLSFLVEIRRDTRHARVFFKEFAITPNAILERDDVILEESYLLKSLEDSPFTPRIAEFQGGVIVEDFIHPEWARSETLPCPA